MAGEYSRRYYVYTVSSGLAGFAALLWLTFWPPDWSDVPVRFDWPALLVFTSLAFLSKFMSFSMMQGIKLTMDTAVYITALLCLGTVPAAWCGFLSMYAKMLWDTADREIIRQTESRPFLENLAAPMFQGGTGALVTLAAGTIVPVGAFVAGETARVVDVIWMAPSLALLFVVMQYTVVLNKYWLRGNSWRRMFREVFLPGLGAEMILVPLAMVMTLTFHAAGEHVAVALVVLTATYLVVNIIFKRLSDATGRLNRKVKDLESLNELGRTLCSTLQADDLGPAVAFQTRSVIEGAQASMVYVGSEEGTGFESRFDFADGFDTARFDRAAAEELASRVMKHEVPFTTSGRHAPLDGVRLTHLDGKPLPPGCWMGVPIRVLEQTLGVLILFASDPDRFTDADLGLLQMISQQAAVALQNSRLYVLATVDGLTRLYVRRYFDRRLMEEVARSQRYGTSFSLMLIDFDDLKDINDGHGHAVGDVVLRKAADIVSSEVRTIDIPARYGGDEFAVLLPEVDWAGARVLAGRIQQRIGRERIRVGEEFVTFSVSIGLASFPEHASDSAAGVIAAADEALSRAKDGGRGLVAVAGEEPAEHEEKKR